MRRRKLSSDQYPHLIIDDVCPIVKPVEESGLIT